MAYIGVSTYSFHRALTDGVMKLFDVIDYIKDLGGEHVEIVPVGFAIGGPEDAVTIRAHVEGRGLTVSNYAIGANFLQPDSASFEREVERVKREVEIARALGADRMRHDAAWAPPAEVSIRHFEAVLPQLAEGCARVADFAAGLGVTTSVENHGYLVQASDRVQKLLFAVDRPNFRTTLDVGNFLCADEDPVAAVRKNVPFASMVHLKDFYRRQPAPWRQDGFFPTAGGHLLRGSVLGYGDLDLPAVVRELRAAGYDGFLSVEFEGQEDERWASRISLQTARTLWQTV